MELELLNYIPEENIKKWTNLTKYCYNIGCVCNNCEYFPEYFKRKCKVKLHVLLLYRKLGKPKDESICNKKRKENIRIDTSK